MPKNPPFWHGDASPLVLDRRRPRQPRLAAVGLSLEGAVRQRQLPRAVAAQPRCGLSTMSAACHCSVVPYHWQLAPRHRDLTKLSELVHTDGWNG